MRYLALICTPTRLAYIGLRTCRPYRYLALHQGLLYYSAEDSDVVEATLYGGASRGDGGAPRSDGG